MVDLTSDQLFQLRLAKACEENVEVAKARAATLGSTYWFLQQLDKAGFSREELLRAAGVMASQVMNSAADLILPGDNGGASP
jgi:hypothetical protein